MVGLQVFQAFASLVVNVSAKWACNKTFCLTGVRGLNGIKHTKGRIWCKPSTQR